MSNEIIKVNKIKKVFRMGEERIIVINDLSLNVEKGKTYCMLGKSGSGKSTLLNLMAGLDKPTKGEIIFKGLHIERMNENQLADFRQKYLGFVFQSYNLLSTLTALENVTLPLIFKKADKKEREEKAMEMLEAVGLADRANHKPSEMSGGQQQRVSIARAFINDPEVVFADEPTGNLDTKTTYEMMDLIMKLTQKNKQTLLMVTHDLEVSDYCQNIIHLSDGKVDRIVENHNVTQIHNT